MHNHSRHVLPRLRRWLPERIEPALYRELQTVDVRAWTVPDEPVPFAEAVNQDYAPLPVGSRWGAPWGTTWLHVQGQVPAWTLGQHESLELVVDLGFTPGIPGFQCEALVFTRHGAIVSALEPLNRAVPIEVPPGNTVEFYLEAASNPDLAQGFTFQRSPNGSKATAEPGPLYQLRQADIGILDTTVWALVQDLRALAGLAEELHVDSPRRAEVLSAIDRALDTLDPDDVHGTAAACREVLAPALAAPAAASAHRVHAVGHAHIDSAWLWPIRETRRKVARTFSNVLRLQQDHPEFIFAASSAQQYAWLKDDHPELFARVKAAVDAGRFVPVGGQWIEPDSNLPSGESLARQFLEGKRFFMGEFGIEPREVWVPDSFGYSGAFPQIALAAGAEYFLTQKLSWNDTNEFPHHSFLWEGIDGSRIFTHFPPSDTYNSMVSAAELHRAERQFNDKGPSNTSLLPFGWGDGGGGPTREMLASAERFHDLDGSPRVQISSPQRFFDEARAEYVDPPVWVGELYMEGHRGVATTQVELKRGNRRSESLLRQAEHWCTHAAVTQGWPYPHEDLSRLWREVLLLQFHDILPGTSIAWVHQEALERYEKVHEQLEQIIDDATHALLGSGEKTTHLNAGPYPLDGVAALGAGSRVVGDGNVNVSLDGSGFVVENALARVQFDSDGHISSYLDLVAGRELIPAGTLAGVLQLHRDTPTSWDAWDLDESYRRTGTDLREAESITALADGVQVQRRFGASAATLEYRLAADSPRLDIMVQLDWHEDEKILKLALPLDVHALRATSEIQFGHLTRDIHTNTSWDTARFETVAHRWLHVSEPGYGVALANEATYGYDITRDSVDACGRATVRISLARAPIYPDPDSDRGHHRYRYALLPGATIPDTVREGYRLHIPLRAVTGVNRVSTAPLLTVEGDAAVIEATKLAEDRSGDVVIRLYEALGTRASAIIRPSFTYAEVVETDLLERTTATRAVVTTTAKGVDLTLRPFQLVTLRFKGVKPRGVV